jgi:hypothetical protein
VKLGHNGEKTCLFSVSTDEGKANGFSCFLIRFNHNLGGTNDRNPDYFASFVFFIRVATIAAENSVEEIK